MDGKIAVHTLYNREENIVHVSVVRAFHSLFSENLVDQKNYAGSEKHSPHWIKEMSESPVNLLIYISIPFFALQGRELLLSAEDRVGIYRRAASSPDPLIAHSFAFLSSNKNPVAMNTLVLS
jgi:hypothetical protein